MLWLKQLKMPPIGLTWRWDYMIAAQAEALR
jgi:hypothetical protein